MQRVLLLALSGLLIFAGFTVPAETQALQWETEVGVGGVYKRGAWAPVCVDLTNRGPSTTAELTIPIPVPRQYGESRRVTSYTIQAEMPQNSVKRQFLYVPSGTLDKILLKQRGTRAIKRDLETLNEVSEQDLLLHVVGGDGALLKFLTGTPKQMGIGGPQWAAPLPPSPGRSGPVSEGELTVAHTPWHRMPDAWLGWDSSDAVILGNGALAEAREAAVAALIDWLRIGGTVFVPGGARAPLVASSPLGRYLPIQVSGTRTVPNLQELTHWIGKPITEQPCLIAAGNATRDATVLCGTREEPLVALRRVGAGHIVMTGFDYAAQPVKQWEGQAGMWTRMLAAAPCRTALTTVQTDTASRRYGYSEAGATVAAYVPEARLPSIWLMVGFLIAYIVALVPVNYIVLNKFDRRELAWLTTPLIVLVFTLAAYGTGYSIRGGKVVLNRLSVIEVMAGSDVARGRGYVGLFSPARRLYDLDLGDGVVGARDCDDSDMPGNVTVLGGPEPKISKIGMNMWTTRTFSLEFTASIGKGLDGTVEYDGKELSAKVTNNTGLPLTRCFLRGGSGQSKERALKPGETGSFTCTPMTTAVTRPGATWSPGGSQPTLSDMAVDRVIFGQSSYRPYYGGPPATTTPSRWPSLVAVCEEPLLPVKLRKGRPRIVDCNLLVARFPVLLKRGARMAVPQYLISRAIIESEGDVTTGDARSLGFGGSGRSSSQEAIKIADGSAVLQWRVPLHAAGGKASDINIRYQLKATDPGGSVMVPTPQPVPADPSEACLYNVAQGQWVPVGPTALTLSGAIEHRRIHPPAPWEFMSRDGQILLKLTAPEGTEATFSGLECKLELKTY